MTAPQHFNDDILQAFARHVPEAASGALEFRSIARERGTMAYVAVAAPAGFSDPIGLLVGRHGTRVKSVVADLGGESANLVRWESEPSEFIRHVLGLSRAGFSFDPLFRFEPSERRVYVTVDKRTERLFTAGEGLRLRLASELVGWQIILSGQDESSGA